MPLSDNKRSQRKIGDVFPFSEDFDFGKQNANKSLQPDIIHSVNASCYYVTGKIGSVRGKFLIDTGSSICVISEKVFDRLGSENIF